MFFIWWVPYAISLLSSASSDMLLLIRDHRLWVPITLLSSALQTDNIPNQLLHSTVALVYLWIGFQTKYQQTLDRAPTAITHALYCHARKCLCKGDNWVPRLYRCKPFKCQLPHSLRKSVLPLLKTEVIANYFPRNTGECTAGAGGSLWTEWT